MKNITLHTQQTTRLCILITLVLCWAVIGCTSTTTASSNAVTLTYWTHVNPPINQVEQKLIARYETLHPNVKITYLPVDIGSLSTKLTTAFAGGSGPDIFNYFQSYAPALEQRGLIAPLDYPSFGVNNEQAFAAQYLPSIVNGFSYKGVVYGVPHEISSYVFWINTAQFQAAGLNPVKDFPKTWQDVAAVGAKLTIREQGRTRQEGFAPTLYNGPTDLINLDAMTHQAGGSLFSEDGKSATVNSPAAVKALQTWSDFAHVQKIYDPSLTLASGGIDLFGNGTAAMTNYGGTFEVKVLQQNFPQVYKHYAVGPWPTFADGQDSGADLYGFGLYVAKTSPQQVEAWKFARFLSDNAATYFKDGGLWLGDNATLNGSITQDFPHWAVFKAAFSRGVFLPPLAHFTEVTDAIERAIQRSILNGQSAQTSLDQAQQDIQPLL
ncbi:MAG TPA: ABC transporter substrate-binding protein [Ktedonobacteraceae bacterium]